MDKSEPLVDVVLYLRGHLLDPIQVTAMLGTDGSKMRAKGEKWFTSTHREVTAKIGFWALESKAKSSSLSDQISWLKGKLINATCLPLQIPGVEEVEVSVFIALGSDDEGDGDYSSQLTAEDLAWLSSINAFLSLKLAYVRERSASQGA